METIQVAEEPWDHWYHGFYELLNDPTTVSGNSIQRVVYLKFFREFVMVYSKSGRNDPNCNPRYTEKSTKDGIRGKEKLPPHRRGPLTEHQYSMK